MRGRLRALAQFDNLVPVAVVAGAIFVTFEPTVLGVQIADRQIVLLLFALLAVDSVVERSGRLHRMEKGLDELGRQLTGRVPVSRVLRTRASFERVDVLIKDARRTVLIVGINLEAAVIALPTLADLAKAGISISLLAMDPDGSALTASARMSGVDVEIRQQKIRQNLNLIKGELAARLPAAAPSKMSAARCRPRPAGRCDRH